MRTSLRWGIMSLVVGGRDFYTGTRRLFSGIEGLGSRVARRGVVRREKF